MTDNKLIMRRFWLQDLRFIHRLHMAIKRNKPNSVLLRVLHNGKEKLMNIISPISNSLMGLKNIIKKNILKLCSLSIQKLDVSIDVQKAKRKLKNSKNRTNLEKKREELVLGFEDGDTIISNDAGGNVTNDGTTEIGHNTRQVKTLLEGSSCQKDSSTCKNCSSCINVDPSPPHSSRIKCQEKGPLVNLHTTVNLPGNTAKKEIFDKSQKTMQVPKAVSKLWKGNSPKINHLPTKPQMGNSSCKNLKNRKQNLKIVKQNNKSGVQTYPGQHRSHLRPTVKKGEHYKKPLCHNKATSYYVILP